MCGSSSSAAVLTGRLCTLGCACAAPVPAASAASRTRGQGRFMAAGPLGWVRDGGVTVTRHIVDGATHSFDEAAVERVCRARARPSRPALVPKLCLGTQVSKLCFEE